MRILIANRGEIARRVIRTAKRLGHETVAVYADPDAAAPFVADADHAVRIGPASLPESYLSIERLLAACADTGAHASADAGTYAGTHEQTHLAENGTP